MFWNLHVVHEASSYTISPDPNTSQAPSHHGAFPVLSPLSGMLAQPPSCPTIRPPQLLGTQSVAS